MAKKLIKLCASALVMLSLVSAESGANVSTKSSTSGKLSEQERAALVERIQNYLNSVKTLKARFSQSNPKSGTLYQGSLILRRGGKIRVQYDQPYGLIMVGRDGELRYFDRKMNKVNVTTTDSTPLGTLLANVVDFKKDIKVLDVRKSFGSIRMLVTKEGMGNGGYLVLVFSDNPISLRQWVIMDQKQNQINFSLINPVYNDAVDEKYFNLNSVQTRL